MHAHSIAVSRRLALALALSLFPASLANAQHDPEEELDVGRLWNGKLGYIEQDNLIVADTLLDVTEQQRRRFLGSMMIDDTEFDIAGTVSAAGVVSIVGDSVLEGIGTSHGLFGIGSAPGGAAFMVGRTSFHGDGGEHVRGSHILLRQFDFDPELDPTPPSVGGDWEGMMTSAVDGAEVEIGASFEQVSATRFVGSMLLFTGDEPLEIDALEASINSDGNVALLGLTPDEIIVPCPHDEEKSCIVVGPVVIVLGATYLTLPPTDDVTPAQSVMTGTYEIHSLGQGLLSPVEQGNLLDFGTFEIIAVIIGL